MLRFIYVSPILREEKYSRMIGKDNDLEVKRHGDSLDSLTVQMAKLVKPLNTFVYLFP